jgi:energy-coupling factor transporter ATP-binding protein EcfA2
MWRRWEPHIHTPGTVLNDEFGSTDLHSYLTQIELAAPTVEALGVTDYLLVRRYEEVVQAKESGRLPNVGLVFCNVEMRLSIETKKGKGINLHILVSPDDPSHAAEIKRQLAKLHFHFGREDYACTEADLIRLGRAHDSTVTDDAAALRAGVNQFKVDFSQLRKLYEETEWLQQHTLIAIAGSSNDGTAGLQDADASFAAQRKEFEAFAHIVLTSTPANIEFWRGEGSKTPAELEATYGGMKPCLHGSDAHRADKVAQPDEDRFTWIKGDTTFEALRQACLEPRLRVHIGTEPLTSEASFGVSSVATPALDWLLPDALPINEGMVAIIGARGSGKTALADLIAHAGNSRFPHDGSQSFLTRARLFFDHASTVAADWTDGSDTDTGLLETPVDLADVHYLTQQFVDRLCSAEAESDELLEEIKRVVFLAHGPESRLGAEDFDSFARLRSSETDLAVEALNQRLDRLSHEVLVERSWHLKRDQLARDLDAIKKELGKTDALRKKLIKPGGKERAEYYTRLSAAIEEREQVIEGLKRRMRSLRLLDTEIVRYTTDVFPQHHADLRRAFVAAGLTDSDWTALMPQFAGDPKSVVATNIAAEVTAMKQAEKRAEMAPTPTATLEGLGRCSLAALKEARITIGNEIGVDKKNTQRLQQLSQTFSTQDAKRRRLEEDLETAKGSPNRLAAILAERAQLYERFFELTIERCSTLTELYEPLQEKLAEAATSANKLQLKVIRDVDLEAWAVAGEGLLDLRKNGRFRGRGSLAEAARTSLLPEWQNGTAADVAQAMEYFRKQNDEALLAQSAVEPGSDDYHQWVVELGRWLYATDHVHVRYRIEYEGVSITELSPGTRGIVLLLLYLALDLEDARPLIIDQPEENLDPKSVFTELIDLFREARTRRQVIIVTHNANLVVNADVDQVIVAACTKHGGGAPPEFAYVSGGLEDPAIRAHVCDILEGGEIAFKQRARRLRVALTR